MAEEQATGAVDRDAVGATKRCVVGGAESTGWLKSSFPFCFSCCVKRKSDRMVVVGMVYVYGPGLGMMGRREIVLVSLARRRGKKSKK